MTPDTLKFYYDFSTACRSCFAYRGPFLDRYTSVILDISEQNRDHRPAIGRKLSFMLVECFQNILKHSEQFDGIGDIDQQEGMFSFRHTDNQFAINSINPIQDEDVPHLNNLLTKVNELSEDDLRQYYLDNLENNHLSSKGGAGLGLIEMARKSGQKIKYQFQPKGDGLSDFYQQITFQPEKSDSQSIEDFIPTTSEYYGHMLNDGIFLHYKGDFTQKSVLPILEMAIHTGTISHADKKKVNRAQHVLIEIIQNMTRMNTRHKEKGQFSTILLGKDSEKLYVLTGNVVTLSEKVLLEEKLEYLLSLQKEELAELHRNTLRASLMFESKDRTGLGLIEVVQGASQDLVYEFYPVDQDQYLFVICARF